VIGDGDLLVSSREVAGLLRALRSPATADELSREALDVRLAVALLERSRTVRGRFRALRFATARARLAALVIAGTIVGTTGAAAANVLPEPLERRVARVLTHVGITLPAADDRERAPVTPPATRPGPAPSSVPTPPAPATAAPPPSGVERGAAVSDAASDGKSRAGEHGKRHGSERPKTMRHPPTRRHGPSGHRHGRAARASPGHADAHRAAGHVEDPNVHARGRGAGRPQTAS
jgi:hypothetical protein